MTCLRGAGARSRRTRSVATGTLRAPPAGSRAGCAIRMPHGAVASGAAPQPPRRARGPTVAVRTRSINRGGPMSFRLPPLPYPADALEPHISRTTLLEHYGQHHRGYIDKVNLAVRGTARADRPLE